MVQREWNFDDYLAMIRSKWLLILVFAILGAGLSYGVSRFLPNRYQSQSQVLIQKPIVPTNFVKPVVDSDINERLTVMRQEFLSPERLEPLIHQFGLFPQEVSNRTPMEALAAELRNDIDIIPIRAPGDDGAPITGFFVRVTMDTPQAAQDVCGAVTSMFIQESARQREIQLDKTTKFLDQQIADAKTQLDAEDAKLAAFQGRHIGFLPDEEQTNVNVLGGLNAELEATTQALVRAGQDKTLAESMLAQQIAARRASQTGQNPDTFGEQLAALQTHLAELKSTYTDDYPDVIKTKIQIDALKKKIADSDAKIGTPDASVNTSIEPAQFTQLRSQIRVDEQTIAQKTKQQEQIQQQIKTYQERIQSNPAVAQEYKLLTRDHQTALEMYNDLLKKRADSVMATNLDTRQEGEQFQVLSAANLPGEPASPNRPLFALGGFVGGLALGIALTFFLEKRDTSVRTERDVELLVQFPVLAVVPELKHASRSKAAQLPARSELTSSLKGA